MLLEGDLLLPILGAMKLGYPTINLALGCTSSHTFRLATCTDDKLVATVQENLECLQRMLAWNVDQGLLFFRISSGLIPFASHPAMTTPWQSIFAEQLAVLGTFIRKHDMRISMHPGQFVVLNSPLDIVYQNSVAELAYHAELLDLMGLDRTHKIQIHLGGLHGDSHASLARFAERYRRLPEAVTRRLVIENDERMASVQDCLALHASCGIPILFDTLHHQINNAGERLLQGLDRALQTWQTADGVPMIDYSNQNPDKRIGAHAQTLDVDHFRRFVKSLKHRDIDIMFEIKNKEASALQAREVINNL